MKWKDREKSSNVEDRRAQGSSGGSGISMGMVMMLWPIIKPLLRTKLGWALIAIGVVAYISGYNPLSLLGMGEGTTIVVDQKKDDVQADFMETVLRDTEVVWDDVFRSYGHSYKKPIVVFFRGSTKSGCGYASAQMGPFYCPNDEKVYLDLGFFDELAKKYNAGGDFAQAYVLAHEIGHHIQNLQGTLDQVQNLKQQLRSEAKVNALQVNVELQADCYAGLWAHHAQKRFNILEEGDIEEALNTASAIGDDTLQKKTQGYVIPDSFTHGSSKQRMEWFYKGFKSGDVKDCNTFSSK
ncbi:MAG: neutral zinc metallopeptidase [Campylobacterales bacterium]|nr:neutral zinc metallopeptidase [Campylobacterales bacterium]